jgi:DNA invertase Pin-like site-specific DNA recombinase
MDDKIRSHHLERTAFVYVRQSSPHQVREHVEGQQRQYALADRARQLKFRQVIVIDQDLGRSGNGCQERPGFARLLTAVCEGIAGAVLALEASRLARNNRDWHHLIDLCGLTDTLIMDADGVYDPRQLNDRLLLGLKGSLAEFELGLLRQRARASFEQKVGRGHMLWEPPVGFVRSEDHLVEKIADRQVQEALIGLFRKFREVGSARQTTLWYCQEQIVLPEAVSGTSGREIVWRVPGRHRVLQILKNPCYAGAFAYGKTVLQTIVEDGRARRSGRRKQPMDQWRILIKDNHAGYITWTEYQENQKILEGNRSMGDGTTRGATKKGPALLAGLLRCGRCGRKMFTKYGGVDGSVPRYLCRGGRAHRGTAACLAVGGLKVDQAVSASVLDAIQPAGIEAALEAMDQALHADQEKQRAIELALEKARYEVVRARRQYDAVDPDNRLVAGELERRWNDALVRVTELEDRLNQVNDHAVALNDAERSRLFELGADLRKLWDHPAASIEIKKRILRTVLHEIVIDSTDAQHQLHLHWQGGVHTELNVQRNQRGRHSKSTDLQVLDLITELSKVCDDRAIAQVLNRLGCRTGQGHSWIASRVAQVRYHYKLSNFQKDDNWLTLQQAADALRVSHTVVQRLIKEKKLPASQVVKYAPWTIQRPDLTLPEVKRAIAAVHAGHKCPPTDDRQGKLPFK